jgi:hypothetical protein
MAKLDWESSRDQLNSVISSVPLTSAEKEVTEGVRDRLEAIGVPYNAAFTGEVDTTKAADDLNNTDAFSTWTQDGVVTNGQAVKAIQYAEDLATGQAGPSVNLFTGLQEGKQALAGLLARITMLVGKVDNSTLAVIIDYRTQLTELYSSRPKDVFTGTYGVVKSVTVSVDEVLTVQEAEVELQVQIDKTVALLSELSFVPPP